jgi:hypothetical protein
MATYFTTTATVATTGSDQRTTIANVRNAFLSCSFVRTVQSGSVDDLTTLSTSSVQNTIRTYDIFAFNDSWQATNPLFIKVVYNTGFGATTQQLFYCRFSMGTAHNSSGSLTGTSTLTEVTDTVQNISSPGTNQPIYATGDGSYMTLFLYSSADTCAQMAVFERLYDTNGNSTGSGFHMVATNANGSNKIIYSQACYYGGTPPAREINSIPCVKPTRAPSTYNGTLLLGTVYPFIGKPLNPSPNILLGDSTTFSTPYATQTYTMYGTTRTYRVGTANLSWDPMRIFVNNRFLLRDA